MKRIILTLAIISIAKFSIAQPQFITKGKIEFEKKVNVWANLSGPFAEEMKKNIPQFSSSFFDYQFNGNKAIYKPGREVDSKTRSFGAVSDVNVYSNYETGTFVSKKSVFEKVYIIEDSLRNAKWKITNDFREIAGFNCRRATTILYDSIFVVAFYTDEIMISGGPESLHGLPGMILGLVINRLHTSWYATKVELTTVKEAEIVPPSGRGEKSTTEKIQKELMNSVKNWGPQADQFFWQLLI